MGRYTGVGSTGHSAREFALTNSITEGFTQKQIWNVILVVSRYADDYEDAREILLTLGLLGNADKTLTPFSNPPLPKDRSTS